MPEDQIGVPDSPERAGSDKNAQVSTHLDEPGSPSRGKEFRRLVRWVWPYTKGSRGTLAWTVVGLVIMLAAQAVIPLQVEGILHHEVWDPVGLAILVVLIIVLLGVGHLAHLGAHRMKVESAVRIRLAIFDHLISTRIMSRTGLDRGSVVIRQTADVENISGALDTSLASGLPGVARIIISLALLATISPWAALVMAIASSLFLLWRNVVGRRLVRTDIATLRANTAVGQNVDETITSSRALSGLRIFPWARNRFTHAVHEAEHRDHAQGNIIAGMVTGAHAAGMVGLLGVVAFAFIGGQESMASVAASFLYVEGVVKGLEALPPWVRSLHLAVASQHRIDEILKAPAAPADQPTSASLEPLVHESGLIGLVTPVELDPDAVLAQYSVLTDARHVTAETVALDASPAEYLRSAQPSLTDGEIGEALMRVGLDRLAAHIDHPIGASGTGLNTQERQRLGLAVALASGCKTIAVGPLIALSDPDTAAPLLALLRAQGATVVISTRSPFLAGQLDAMAFVTADNAVVGQHEELLIANRDYARIWEQRLQANEIDLGALGLGEDAERALHARLVTERFAPGEAVYREGDLADRVVFVISGQVEVLASDRAGHMRRAALLGPGCHCGDLRLTVGERRAESVVAVDDTVVRSLSRDAISAGMMGLLDRSPIERRIVASILRDGPATPTDLLSRLPEATDEEFTAALDLLLRDGALRESDGELQVVQRRAVKAGAAAILDRLGGL